MNLDDRTASPGSTPSDATPATVTAETLGPRLAFVDLIRNGVPIVQYTVRIYAAPAVVETARVVAVDMELAGEFEASTRSFLARHLDLGDYTVDIEIGDVTARLP